MERIVEGPGNGSKTVAAIVARGGRAPNRGESHTLTGRVLRRGSSRSDWEYPFLAAVALNTTN